MATPGAVRILAHAAGSSCRQVSAAFAAWTGQPWEESTNTGIRGRDDPPERRTTLENHKSMESMENHMRLDESPVVSLGSGGIVVPPRLGRATRAAMAAHNGHGPSRQGHSRPAQPRSFTPAPAVPQKPG